MDTVTLELSRIAQALLGQARHAKSSNAYDDAIVVLRAEIGQVQTLLQFSPELSERWRRVVAEVPEVIRPQAKVIKYIEAVRAELLRLRDEPAASPVGSSRGSVSGAVAPGSNDRHFMGVAIELSRSCLSEEGLPRPQVGAVLVQDGQLVAKAFRGEIKSGEHAEYTLLERRLSGRSVAGSVLYTTLEPCIKRGEKKVPCAEHILRRKISRVVIGMLDPNQEIRGEGVWRLREHGVHVALCEPEQMAQIEEINRVFVDHFRRVR